MNPEESSFIKKDGSSVFGEPKTQEIIDWEQREGLAFARIINKFAEGFHRAFIGGPEGIAARFQKLELTDEDLDFLYDSLPKESAAARENFRQFLLDIDKKVKSDNLFYVEQLGNSAQVTTRQRLLGIIP